MADFASPDWFDEVNARLATVPRPAGPVARIVLTWSDGPSTLPHALTFTAEDETVSVAAGDHFLADTVLTMPFADAMALANGSLDAADAIRAGRLTLQGNAAVVVDLWAALSGRRA